MRAPIGILCLAWSAWAAGAAPDRVREAAAKAVASIQSSQKNWYAKQSCVSCHQQVLPTLAFRDARAHRIPVDEAAARADAVKAFGYLADFDRAVQFTHVVDPAMADSYTLVAAEAAGVKPSIVTAVYARHIASRQKPDGHWITLDQRPPQSYSSFTTTAISLRAIQLYGHPKMAADTEARVEKARAWLASSTPHTTEERVMRLLGLAWAGADRATLDPAARDLEGRQQSDGGWNSLDGRSSDAYSTGEALVALHDAGEVATSNPAWQRGIRYLLSTQQPDGSWHVVSRLHPPAPVSPPYFETGYPYGHDQFISTMGSSWAVRALAEALGAPRKIETPILNEAAPGGVEPWAETILFGTPGELRVLLDKKFDPDSATKSGGTTALMLAMPDLEKARLLIDRGAGINRRAAKTRYSALMVAAQYPNGNPAMRLLLDRGAQVRLPPGSGAPLFNASPLMLAAFAGNPEPLVRLHDAGNPVDQAMVFTGLFAETPLDVVATLGDAATLGALLDCGARVDEPDQDGITALGWAAISNHPEAARVLIEHGAAVNHVDRKKMTALLYAASIDFGDSVMIDELLKAGANPAARTPEGLTAQDLARKYHHSHLIARLAAGR